MTAVSVVRKGLILAASGMWVSGLHAAESQVDAVAKHTQMSGFVSIRGGQIFQDEVNYLSTLEKSWSFSNESVVGLQTDTQTSDNTSVSVQLKNKSGKGTVDLEWAYLEYAFAPDLKGRVGRLRAPGYMLSEFLDVGYAYPWVSVPEEVYGWLPFSRYEGMDLRYWKSIGGADVRVMPFVGTTNGQKINLGNTEYTDANSRFGGIDLQLSYDIFTVRAGYSRYLFDLRNAYWDRFIDSVVDGEVISPNFGPESPEIKRPGFVDFVEKVLGGSGPAADNLDALSVAKTLGANADAVAAERDSMMAQLQPYKNIPKMNGSYSGEFAGVGFSADNGKYLLMSEVSRSVIGGVYPDIDSGYVLFGYRFGKVMPHFTFSKMYTTDDRQRPDLQPFRFDPAVWGVSPLLAPAIDGTDQLTDILIGATGLIRLEQERYSLGVRWDAVDNVAVKAEIFEVRLINGSYGYGLPSSLIDVALSGGSASAASGGLSIPDAPSHITGVKMSVDVVF